MFKRYKQIKQELFFRDLLIKYIDIVGQEDMAYHLYQKDWTEKEWPFMEKCLKSAQRKWYIDNDRPIPEGLKEV